MRFLPSWFAVLSFVSLVHAADLTTLKGKKHSGELVSIDDKAVVIKTAEGEVSTPLPEILQLTLQAPPQVKFPDKFIDVELIDGTLLHCSGFSLKAKEVQLTVLPDWKLTVPMKSCVAPAARLKPLCSQIRLKPPGRLIVPSEKPCTLLPVLLTRTLIEAPSPRPAVTWGVSAVSVAPYTAVLGSPPIWRACAASTACPDVVNPALAWATTLNG